MEQAQQGSNSQASVKSPCPGQQSCALVSENEFSGLEKEVAQMIGREKRLPWIPR